MKNNMQEYQFTYSFIIPHHNSPELLNRCLDSIPQREDIQIIVVDDNSAEDKCPCIKRDDVEVIYIDAEHTKGAGRARNYGLKAAKGKWLLFADCDDFYVEDFLNVLDSYSTNNDLEILYFSCLDVDSATMEKYSGGRAETLKGYIKDALSGNKEGEDKVRFKYRSPWYKMVNSSLVKKYGLFFEEVKKGNDMMFSFSVSYLAKTYIITERPVYCVTYRSDSMTFGIKSIQMYKDSIAGKMKVSAFNRFIDHEDWTKPLIYYILSDLKYLSFKSQIDYIFMLVRNILFFYNQRNKYVEYILSKKQYG